MKAELIDYMGDDLRVANAARVSFDKESDWKYTQYGNTIPKEWWGGPTSEKRLPEKDISLLNYLAKHNHWTPFSHIMITMRETVPIFVARQRFKHVVGFTYNETSRRYVDSEPEFYTPDVWRKAAENKKQGSSDEGIKEQTYISRYYDDVIAYAENCYNEMIGQGVAPEQARMVLPQSMYTSYYVTGSLSAWARAYRLRSDTHAQLEIQELAGQWNDIISGLPELKYSWNALINKEE